jgi:hypothetical protein
MLDWAGYSIAPANAHPEVLARVDEVTASNDDDGVALVIEKLLAGEGDPRPAPYATTEGVADGRGWERGSLTKSIGARDICDSLTRLIAIDSVTHRSWPAAPARSSSHGRRVGHSRGSRARGSRV